MFDLELKNKIVIITGGSDGLGRATARRFSGTMMGLTEKEQSI